MFKRFSEFFQERDGQLSSMRLFSFISLLNAIVISWFGIVAGKEIADVIMSEMPWLVAAFVPKAIQRFAEVKEFYGVLKNKKGSTDEQPSA